MTTQISWSTILNPNAFTRTGKNRDTWKSLFLSNSNVTWLKSCCLHLASYPWGMTKIHHQTLKQTMKWTSNGFILTAFKRDLHLGSKKM